MKLSIMTPVMPCSPAAIPTGDIAHYFGLSMFILAGIAMRAIDDKAMGRSRFGGHFGTHVTHGLSHGFGIVVRAVCGTTQYHMAIRVAECLDCTGTAQVSMPKNVCCWAAAKQPFTAALTEPSVAFLKPPAWTGRWLAVGESGFPCCARRWHPSSPRPR